MLLRVLGSSSAGNCYLLESEDETLIIECGISFKEIKKALYFNLRNVVGCLVTHEHKDHSKSLQDLLRAGINVYTSAGTSKAILKEKGIIEPCNRLKPIQSLKGFKIGGFDILPFDVKHDASEPLGFIVNHKDTGDILLATDTYYIEYRFKKLSHILIECNYSAEILEQNNIDEARKERLLRSHFSLENVKEFIKANDNPSLQNIVLLHLSDGNSNAKEFKEQIYELTGKRVEVADKGLEIELNRG